MSLAKYLEGMPLLCVPPLALPDGGGQRLVIGPSHQHPLHQCALIHSEAATPLPKMQGFPIQSEHPIISPVCALLKLGCPTAILRFVISVAVLSVNRKPLAWMRAHIQQKILETFSPSVTHNNSAPAIQVIRILFRSIAAHQHSLVCSILPGNFSADRMPMRAFGETDHLIPKTAAGFCKTTPHVSAKNQRVRTAIARASPFYPFKAASNHANGNQSSESLTCHVFKIECFITFFKRHITPANHVAAGKIDYDTAISRAIICH